MVKVVINIVRWDEEGEGSFEHTGRTLEMDSEDLGLVKEHTDEVRIDSKYPLVVTERTFVTPDGKSIRNIAIDHQLIGLVSDYYIYNDPSLEPETME